ncbi:hypothetical protein QOZ80_9AG0689780 [Eleusine coracana subsp. coracana]|nr:hypothetical protein QOZ80_9AG0689780 [Eleusine coracana subsp. coracana]
METGSHELTITGYSGTKGLGVGQFISSSEFTVGGHQWLIRYYPDGFDEEHADWISVSLIRADKTGCTVEVRARYEFALLDKFGVPSFIRECRVPAKFKDHSGWNFSPFVKRKELESSSYLQDDCIQISCKVTVVKFRKETAPVQFRAAPPTELHQHLGDLFASKIGADVKFVVGRETIAAHKIVLAARSSVFKAELFGPMKEERARRICIDDMEPRVFNAMLHFIYTDSLPEMDKRDSGVMAQHLLVAADRFDLKRLRLICEDILCVFIDESTIGSTLVLAEQHGCHLLKERCFKFLMSPGNMKAITETGEFEHLLRRCPSLLKELLVTVAP